MSESETEYTPNISTGEENVDADALDSTTASADEQNNKDGRPSCKFGRQCFRRNSMHRSGMAHPGDIDYIIPNMPEPTQDASKCKYGRQCYRLNPEHFKNFTHPRNINIQQNYVKYVIKRQKNRRNNDDSVNYGSDEDPFAGDSDGSEYLPSDHDS